MPAASPSRTTGADPGNPVGPGPSSRALVLGGSLAGLLTASVLTEYFTDVVVVDRDDLAEPLRSPRRGVPQGRHTHGLLVGGARAIESLLPGITSTLRDRGALEADVMARTRWLMGGHVLTHDAPGLVGVLASRTLLESEVRARVAALPGIRLISGYEVTRLLASPDRSRVTGAALVPSRQPGTSPAASPGPVSGHPDDAGPLDVTADLVVDATGRGTRAGEWLSHLGYAAPEETVVDAGVRYVTRRFRAEPGVLDDLDADVVGTDPATGLSAVALRQEGSTWTVTLGQQFGDEPPADVPGMLAAARHLPTPGIAEVLTRCEPIGDAVRCTYPASRWRRWEKLRTRPEGFVVIGDAVCSFNPVYGQGMSSAALQVTALRDLLRDGGLPRLASRSARAFAEVASIPWSLATGQDRMFPGQPAKPLPERLIDRYMGRLLAVASEDPVTAMAFARVLNLLAAPPSVLAPRVAWHVLRPSSRAVIRRARAAQTARAEVAAHGRGLAAVV